MRLDQSKVLFLYHQYSRIHVMRYLQSKKMENKEACRGCTYLEGIGKSVSCIDKLGAGHSVCKNAMAILDQDEYQVTCASCKLRCYENLSDVNDLSFFS